MEKFWKPIGTLGFIVTLLFPGVAFSSANYCMAIRGNGEAQPAHLGAMASVVEKLGLPQAQSGGSSGALSMFFLDSIAANPWVSEVSGDVQKSRAAFLLKALHGVGNFIAESPEANEVMDLVGVMKGYQAAFQTFDPQIFQQIAEAESPKNLMALKAQMLSVKETLQGVGIGTSGPYKELLESLIASAGEAATEFSNDDFKKIQFYAKDLYQSIVSFGSFEYDDPLIFFRAGLVDFASFAKASGRVATFISNNGTWGEDVQNGYDAFLEACFPGHVGQSWNGIILKKPRCQGFLNKTLKIYFSQQLDWEKVNVVTKDIGAKIVSIPSTSVLSKSAFDEAAEAMGAYHLEQDTMTAAQFRISDSRNVRFGYWGPTDTLRKIERNLKTPFESQGQVFDFSQDAKSQKFLSLGPASWLEALRLSPAEPGLANLQPFSVHGNKAYSAGGWSDLHPTKVLKAAGCENIVYITRKGGESRFAQGMGKQLLNFDGVSWDFIRSPENHEVGNPQDLSSAWSQLYNVGNVESSYMKSLALADTVLCTDWDTFDVKTQLVELIEDGYRAPLIVPRTSPLASEFQEQMVSVLEPSRLDRSFVGCRAPQSL